MGTFGRPTASTFAGFYAAGQRPVDRRVRGDCRVCRMIGQIGCGLRSTSGKPLSMSGLARDASRNARTNGARPRASPVCCYGFHAMSSSELRKSSHTARQYIQNHSRNREFGLPSDSVSALFKPSFFAWHLAWQAVRVALRVADHR
jgi:hypothetical protein